MGSTRSYLQTLTVVAGLCLSLAIDGLGVEVRAKAGGVVELECRFPPSDPAHVSSASLHVVEWVRRGLDIPVLIKFGSHVPRVHPQYEGRVSLVRVAALRLAGLQLDDRGLYECRILLLDQPTDELQNGTWTLLSVTAPPTFTEAPPPVVEVLVGGHLSLACVANGNPPPAITWLKDGSRIQRGNGQEGALSVKAVSMQSAGQYTCHASNSEGNATCVTKVKIKGPPVIVVPPESTSLNMSQNALLRCQATADPPNMTYVWRKGGENVHHIESLKSRVKIMVDGTLLISGLVPGDSGNYSCMPTNGLLTPPTASANLTVMHPAKALGMPRQTYLAMGMDGTITCPTLSQPPLLRVDWTKDGQPLDLSLYPGWTLRPEGSLFMATVNEDAAGVYTCTPYNSYGSMGPSLSTEAILQDPPSFSITPEKQYRQEAGRTLLIPCQGNDDPTTKVTWSKVDLARRIAYSIEPNGSLLLRPLSKEHQGAWECTAANRVASVKSATRVFVLGTSPHAATSLTVSTGSSQANVSWEAGYDGGSAQTFSVWVKQISPSDSDRKQQQQQQQQWFSVAVPLSSGTGVQVSGLSPSTSYQFSVLSHNKMGTGPFSEIATARTANPPQRKSSKPRPPASLSANQGQAGVVLRWSPPEAQRPPLTAFVLQSRTEKEEEWLTLDRDIDANSTEIVVPGLRKDCVYELRLLSRRGELLSEPGPSVNVSTIGMETYPATSRLLELVPRPWLAGVLGGAGLVCLALVLLLGSACVISHRRDRRKKKKTTGGDPHPPAIYKRSPSIKTPGTGSPDSVLKKSLLPATNFYPTTSSTTSTTSSSSSSSSKTDRSPFGTRNHQEEHPPSTDNGRGRLARTTSVPVSSSIELISRGPDGRFAHPMYDKDSLIDSVHGKKSSDRPARVQRSLSLHSERDDKKGPFVLSVDLPPFGHMSHADTTSKVYGTDRRLSHCNTPRIIADQKSSYDGLLLDPGSVCSNGSLASVPQRVSPKFPVLPHIRSGLGQPSTNASALVLQMEHERERGNLSHCLKLAREREELERELQRYTLGRSSAGGEPWGDRSSVDLDRGGARDVPWEYRSRTLPHKNHHQGTKGGFGMSQSHLSASSEQWGARPLVPPLTPRIPAHARYGPSSPTSISPFEGANHYPAPSFTKQTPVQPEEEEEEEGKNRPGLPHVYAEHHGRHGREEAAPEAYANSSHSSTLRINDSRRETENWNNLSRGSLSTLSFHNNTYEKIYLHAEGGRDVCVEMSVDEPELEVCVMQPPKKPMLHQRIASHVQRGHSLTRGGRYEDMSRGSGFTSRSPTPVDDFAGVPASRQPQKQHLWKDATRDSKIRDSKRRSQSLDSRRRRESHFLPPDAWIDSLSQENCSVEPPRPRPDSLCWEPRSSLRRNTSRFPSSPPPDTQYASHSPPARDLLFSKSSPEESVLNPDVPCHYEPRREASIIPHDDTKWPLISYQEAMEVSQGTPEAMEEASRRLLPNGDDDPEALEGVEAGGYEGVPQSGSSYSSYASSGRGSMEPANGRLSLGHLSPTLTCSPETVEEIQGGTEERHDHKMEPSQRRKASVDENYEWDAADCCSQHGNREGLLLPATDLMKPVQRCGLPGMHLSTTEAVTNCTHTRPCLLPGHGCCRCSAALPEPDTVLF